jgi:F-type H+-transporting ATPase subunit a
MTMIVRLLASAETIPELPNAITLLYNRFPDTPWAIFLHHWENLVFSFLIAAAISFLFYWGAKKQEQVPTGLQNVLEWVVEGIRKLVGETLGGEGEKYVPFIGSMFIYILAMNIIGLAPLMKSPSSNLNVTFAHALCVFALVQYLNFKNFGVKGFLYHLAGSPKDWIGWLMVPLLLPIEILTQLARPVTLAFRLFGNIFGEDILMGYFALLGATVLPFILPLQTPFVFLALLTSVMQALVFALLTTIYILLALPSGEELH